MSARDRTRVVKGVLYFPTYQAARQHARDNGLPTDGIRDFDRGWAIQLRVSGAYAGPADVLGKEDVPMS